MTYAELEAKPRPEHALPCCCLGCRSTLERCSEALPSRQAPNFQVSPEKAPPPSPCRIILEVAVRPPRALWPHMSSPTPFPPSWPTRSQPSRGLIGGAAHPRTPPFHAARRPPGTSWKIPVTCARPRSRASPRPQRPQPALAPQGSRAAGFTRPRGPGWPALLKRPGTHHHAGTAGRHDGIGRRARAKAV